MANTTNFGWETPDDTDLVKDGAAAIRTLGSSIDTSFVDLKGGTTGQILSKASNTDLDYTWINNDQGDITAVTAGTGLTGGGTTGAVTITNDMATTITASGDIVVGTGNATYDNLPIGTTGQVLTADTTVSPYKVKWATPAASTKTWTLLNGPSGTNLTGAQDVTVSGISGKQDLLVLITNGSSANAASSIGIRINGDSGNNYYTAGNESLYTAAYGASTFNTFGNYQSNAILVSVMSNSSSSLVNAYVRLDGCQGGDLVGYWGAGGASSSGSNGQSNLNLGGYYDGTAVVTSITARSYSGNWDSGVLYVYGA